ARPPSGAARTAPRARSPAPPARARRTPSRRTRGTGTPATRARRAPGCATRRARSSPSHGALPLEESVNFGDVRNRPGARLAERARAFRRSPFPRLSLAARRTGGVAHRDPDAAGGAGLATLPAHEIAALARAPGSLPRRAGTAPRRRRRSGRRRPRSPQAPHRQPGGDDARVGGA